MFAIVHSEDLLDRLRAGDSEAFRLLVRRHHDALIFFARRFVDDEATAEELVQETWLVVVGDLDSFEGRSTLKAWIFAILGNLARTRARRESKRQLGPFAHDADFDAIAADDERFNEKGAWSRPPSRWRLDPERTTERAQLLELVKRGMDELNESQETVMRLRDVEGLDTAEVAEVLQIEPGHVRVLLHRARSSVRAYVEDALHRGGNR